MSRVTVVTLSSLLFLGLVAAVIIGVLNYVNDEDKRPSTSTKAVQEMCQPTDYKEACFKSLSKVNSDDPKELVRAAFESTITEISEVANKSTVLKELEKDPKTAEAVKNCKELFQDAIDDLKRSFGEVGEFDLNKVDKMLENLKIWLSATITYQETCLDGFDNTTGDASQKVRKILETSMQMSSNGLAIVTEMSTLLGTLDLSSYSRRRLLSDDRQVVGHYYDTNVVPYWKNNRRLLSSADENVQGHDGDDTLLEDDEPDRRRRRLLSSVNRVVGHDRDNDDDLMPNWVDAKRRKLLQATNLVDDLKQKANVVVAKDGSGKYKTIEEAIKEIPKYANESFIIYIKEGVYNEYLVLYKWMTNVVFVGDGPTKTRITNNKNFADGTKTFKTATLSVLGDYFMAKDIGVENSAGAIKHQAVALRVQSDQSIFYNCHMDGYQDTLYTHTYRQFYRDCRVTGTIDFIFGDAAAFFQNCTFVVRKPLDNQRCIVTAQGRMERHQPTGIIIHRCRFEADPDYYPVRKNNTAYLGRPWKEYSKTIIMESYIDDSIAPEGWLPWEGTFALETCYYGEYNNEGPGSNMANRVTWRGIKHIVPSRAEKFMPPQLYGNDDWIRASRVPYDPSLYAFAPGPGSDFDEDTNAPQGAPSFYSTIFGTSSSGGSISSSSGQSSSSSHSGSSSGGSSSSSSASGNHNDGSKSTPTGTKSGSSGSSSTTTNTGGSTEEGSTGSSSTTSTSSAGSSSSTMSTPSSVAEGGSTGSYSTTPSTSEGGSTGSSSTTPSTSEGGSTGSSSTTPSTSEGGSTGSSSTTPSTSEGGSTGSSSTTPSTSKGGSTGSSSTTTTTTTTTTTPTSEGASSGSSSTTSATSSSSSSADESGSTTTTLVVEAPAPSPVSTEPPTTIASLETPSSTMSTISQSPSSSPSASPIKKQTGPITVRELERILMTNEEMGEEEDDAANDDMSGNVPDGDEPSPAMVEPMGPGPAPVQGPSIAVSPSLGPAVSTLGPGPSPGPSPSMSPSEEVSDWFPPATAPGPDVEAADEAVPKKAPPPKSSNAMKRVNNVKVYEVHVIVSGMILWLVFAL